MNFLSVISFFSIFLVSLSPIHAQQPYIGMEITRCRSTDNSTSVLGYTCNGVNRRSCQSYLTFRSRPPYNNVSSISRLLAADPLQISRLNSVPENATFDTNQMVLVAVNCTCSGQFYQFNLSYVVTEHDTYFLIANNTFEGLTTCQALIDQNRNLGETTLVAGERISVPLRCACPTRRQTDAGARFLLSYLVSSQQTVSAISSIFGVNTARTLEANSLTDQNSFIYPFTTLLVPLRDPPSSSQMAEPPPPPSPPPPPPPTPTSNNGANRTWVFILVGVLGGISVILLIGGITFCLFFRKTQKKKDPIVVSDSFDSYNKPESAKNKMEENPEIFLESLSSIAQSLLVYKFKDLQIATDNFSPDCLIKGSVYRGKINGDFAAIKKMNGDVTKEINLLNKINHFNLIRLSGVCFNDGNWYLVYEYASNGPLSDWIYNDGNGQKHLTWTQRMQIALDIATGLNYLHSYTSPPYVHKDLNSSNVLIDADFRGKIGNFALARSAEGQEGHFALTKHIVGTKGYMAPEYLENGLVSPKLDVYSFGVLLLEIITGREGVNLELHDNLVDFVDPALGKNYPSDLVIFLSKLINVCLEKNPLDRPSMDEVVQSLSRTMNTSLAWEQSNSISGYQNLR